MLPVAGRVANAPNVLPRAALSSVFPSIYELAEYHETAMSVIPFTCPRCAGLIQAALADAGRQIPCPVCHHVIWVPPDRFEPSPEPPPVARGEPGVEPPPVELLALTCPACGGLFQVATTLAGSRVACPNCNALVMAAVAESVEPPLPPPPIAPPQSLDRSIAVARPATPPAAESLPVEQVNKDRAQRRRTRNLLLWIACLAILLVVLWLFL
jgi:hypothetical protein